MPIRWRLSIHKKTITCSLYIIYTKYYRFVYMLRFLSSNALKINVAKFLIYFLLLQDINSTSLNMLGLV